MARSPLDLEAGQILARVGADLFGDDVDVSASRYEIRGKLGAGGMGVVYEAYDPLLDCTVALKQLHAHLVAEPGFLDRLRAEARAMARLRAEPHVVTLYDFFVRGSVVFVVMELVAGTTLRAWQLQPRRSDEVLEMYVQAGRGLAAAHRAGLVHRDFKPENVLIDRRGIAKVSDFGLVRDAASRQAGAADSAGDTAAASHVGSGSVLTRPGGVVGTPRYMAPEQIRGDPAEARSDQFSFCVALWEALFGEHPFIANPVPPTLPANGAGAENTTRKLSPTSLQLGPTPSPIACAEAILHAPRRPVPAGAAVPAYLVAALVRGLSREPHERFASMDELLAALARGRARARFRVAVVALAGIAALAAGAEGHRRWDIAERVGACEAAGAAIDAVWNDETRRRVREAFVATGVGHAAATADKFTPWIDAQAGAWRAARTDACLNAGVRARWDSDTLVRSLWCLDDRRIELESLIDEFARADATAVRKAVTAASTLRAIAPCVDAVLVQREPVPPLDGHQAARELRQLLSRSASLSLAGKYPEATTTAVQVRARAESLRWPTFAAVASFREGHGLHKQGLYGESEAVLRRAYFAAARANAWEVAADAGNLLIIVVGKELARPAEGDEWARHAEIAAVHAGDVHGLREADRLNHLGAVRIASGEYVEAKPHFARALEIREEVLGREHTTVANTLNNLALVHDELGDYAEARALHQRALTIREQALGADHPDVAVSLGNLAIIEKLTGDYAASRALHERALAINERSLGLDHPVVAVNAHNLANVNMRMGRFDDARRLYERALAIDEKIHGPDHPEIAYGLVGLAHVLAAMGAHEESQRLYERALAIREQALGPDHPDVASCLDGIGRALRVRGAHAEAQAVHARALALRERALGREHVSVALGAFELGGTLLAAGKPREALPLLERAVTIFGAHEGVQEGELAAHFDLARAIAATNGERARAVAEAGQARDGFREGGEATAEELAEVEAWLAAHDVAQ